MIALKALTEHWFTPEDEDAENPTQFNVRGLSGLEVLELSQVMQTANNGDVILGADAIKILLSRGLIGWKDFYDEDNSEVKFTANQQVNIARLPFIACKAIADEIFKRTEILAPDKKKS